jgi:drug/metabolite transporter (DMT)-like permease
MAMSLGGVTLISVMQMQNSTGETSAIGFILLSGAVLSAAFYNILSRKASAKFKPIEITYVMMIVGAFVFNIIGISDSLIKGYSYFIPLAEPAVLGSILYLGILSSIIAFFCLNYTLSKIPAVQGALFANLVTVISVIAGVIFLNEGFPVYKIIGSILIIVGVFGTNYFHIADREREVKIENR